MEDFKTRNEPATKVKSMQESIDQVTGSYASVYDYRTNDYIDSLARFIYLSLWDVLIFMLLGMAFFKLGILTGTCRANGVYKLSHAIIDLWYTF
jgi:uncharacterized protein